MNCALLADVVVREGPSVLELLSTEYKSLLVDWDSLPLEDKLLESLYSIGELNVCGNASASESLHKYLRHE